MQLIPALDIRGQVVVRAIGGRRGNYRPLTSQLTNSTDPLTVAEAIRAKLGFSDFYVADLDSIDRTGAGLTEDDYRRFRDSGLSLWLDAGIRDSADAVRLADQVAHIVVGSETISGLSAWREIVDRLGPDRAVFSLDLRDRQSLSCPGAWNTADPRAIGEQVVDAGCKRLIVLDVAHVGLGRGIGTENLCQEILRQHPGLAVITGGGIRDGSDLRRLQAIGLAGVLVATALHDGSLKSAPGH